MKRLVLLMGLAALLCGGPALAASQCPEQRRMPRSLHTLLHEAQQLMEQKKPAQAAAKLAKYAQDRDDPHPQLSFLQGILAYQAKQLNRAGRFFAAAIKADPCFQAALRNLAVVRYEQERPDEAALLTLRAFELSKPKDYNLLYEASVFWLTAGKTKKAIPLLQQLAARTHPKKSWLTALVRAYMDDKQPRQAEQVLQRLLAGWPGDASLWRLAASLATMRSDYNAAAAYLAVAYRLDPPELNGWRRLAELYRASGAPLAAAPLYLKSMGNQPSKPKDLDLMAQVYLQGHDLKEARRWAQAAAKAEPTARRWSRLGRIAMEQKDYPAARRAYAAAAGLEPKGGRHWLMAGYAAWQGEALEQAAKDFALALKQAKSKSTTAKEASRGLKSVRELIKLKQQG